MTLTDEERTYLIGTINELVSDLNAMLRLPRIDEEEWSKRYGELPHPDDDQLYQPLEDTLENRAMLLARDPRLVWSVIPDPAADDDEDGYLIVPGYWSQMAEGWHLTTIPWNPTDLVVGHFVRGGDC